MQLNVIILYVHAAGWYFLYTLGGQKQKVCSRCFLCPISLVGAMFCMFYVHLTVPAHTVRHNYYVRKRRLSAHASHV